MNANKFKDTLNGKNLLSDFNLVIQTGTAGLLDYPDRKESLPMIGRRKTGRNMICLHQNLKIRK